MAIRSRDNEEDERSRDTTCDVGAVGDCRASDRREMGISEFLDRFEHYYLEFVSICYVNL